jgi:hypothetical protein
MGRGGPPSLLYNGYRVSFPWVKRPGRGVEHPPPTIAEVKEGVRTPPQGRHGLFYGKLYPLFTLLLLDAPLNPCEYDQENSYSHLHVVEIFTMLQIVWALRAQNISQNLHLQLYFIVTFILFPMPYTYVSWHSSNWFSQITYLFCSTSCGSTQHDHATQKCRNSQRDFPEIYFVSQVGGQAHASQKCDFKLDVQSYSRS